MSRRPDHRPAFTLVEVTLAIAIGSVLMLALGGALMLTTSASDTADDSSAKALQASSVAAGLAAELSTATAIASSSPTDLLFTVPDRNGDGSIEKIEYTWSGRAGDPLYRAYNGSTPAIVVPALQSLALSTATRPAPVPVESAEQVLASCDSPTGASFQTDDVDDNNWDAQYVRPSLPSGATAWKISRVRLYLKQASGSSNTWRVSIQTADASLKPSGTILASLSPTSGSISSSAGWVEYAIGPVSGISASTGVCIVIDGTPGGKATVYRATGGSNQPFNTHFLSTSNGGSSWSTPTDTKDLRFILTGTYTTMVEP